MAPAEIAAASPGRVRVFLCGDVMTGRGVDQILPHPSDPRLREPAVTSALDYVRLAEQKSGPIGRPVDPAYVWGAAFQEWRRARPDLRLANLETSVTRSGTFAPKGINYRMNPANVACLSAAGFNCCTLANNHVLDFGTRGLLETLEALHAQGIATAGAGHDAQEAARPAVLQTSRGQRVLVIGLGEPGSGIPPGWAAGPLRPGVNLVELTPEAAGRIGKALEPWRRPSDLVVASVHWGSNWGYEVPEAQRRFAHALVDAAGVSAVYGHSSHHPRGMEVYKGRLVLYGCGDFLNDYEGIGGYEAFRGDLVLMYFADLDAKSGALTALEMVPLKIRRFQLTRPAAEEIGFLTATLDRQAARFGARVVSSGSRLALTWT